MLDYITSKNINIEIFFTYGIPGENEEVLEETYKMRNEIVKKHGRRNCLRALSIEMEPGSPWYINPERFGVVTSRRSFADFVKAHSIATEGTYTSLGYYIISPIILKNPLIQRIRRVILEGVCRSLNAGTSVSSIPMAEKRPPLSGGGCSVGPLHSYSKLREGEKG
jgi:radical SAM superfamily enzyme YgiQ (UPF0313 family)